MAQIPPWPARPRSHCALPGSGRAWHITRNSSRPNEIKDLQEACPAIGRFGIAPVRGAISRVDAAFGAFFRWVKNGEDPGYPRFKSRARFRTTFYDTPTGWHLRGITAPPARKDGRAASEVAAALSVQGVGDIPLGQGAVRQLRRLVARGGEPRRLTRTRSGAWRACVGFRGEALRPLPETRDIGGVDRGIWVSAALPDDVRANIRTASNGNFPGSRPKLLTRRPIVTISGDGE